MGKLIWGVLLAVCLHTIPVMAGAETTGGEKGGKKEVRNRKKAKSKQVKYNKKFKKKEARYGGKLKRRSEKTRKNKSKNGRTLATPTPW